MKAYRLLPHEQGHIDAGDQTPANVFIDVDAPSSAGIVIHFGIGDTPGFGHISGIGVTLTVEEAHQLAANLTELTLEAALAALGEPAEDLEADHAYGSHQLEDHPGCPACHPFEAAR